MASKIKIDFKEISEEVIKNARNDREVTKELLYDILEYVKKCPDKVADAGFTMAKYMETMQRSNEQLVKIAALAKKDEKSEDSSLSDEEKEEIFSKLNEGTG